MRNIFYHVQVGYLFYTKTAHNTAQFVSGMTFDDFNSEYILDWGVDISLAEIWNCNHHLDREQQIENALKHMADVQLRTRARLELKWIQETICEYKE